VAHEPLQPATLIREELAPLARAAGARPVLDLACGRGRNALAVAQRGMRVCALDRDAATLVELGERTREAGLAIARLRADVEAGPALPFATGALGGVLVFRFLFRPLAAEIARVLAPGGLLVYETFTTAQRVLGSGPRRAAFLLEPGELATLFPQLQTLRSEEGVFAEPEPTALARLVAIKPA